MGKIRLNELARELEIRSNEIIEYLIELGIPDKRSHSSALDDELANKVRDHFGADGEHISAGPIQSTLEDKRRPPMSRSIEHIKRDVRESQALGSLGSSAKGPATVIGRGDLLSSSGTREIVMQAQKRVLKHYVRIPEILKQYALNAGALETG
jgi:hypothetical protein